MAPHSNRERVVRLLTDGRDRAIRSGSNAAASPLSVDAPAEEVVDGADAGTAPADAEGDGVDDRERGPARAGTSLRHDHLPRLDHLDYQGDEFRSERLFEAQP